MLGFLFTKMFLISNMKAENMKAENMKTENMKAENMKAEKFSFLRLNED